MNGHGGIVIKRIYETPDSTDGIRILVDRLWPRGVSKEAAQLTLWMKEVAPSSEARIRFAHMPERFEEFKHSYMAELAEESVQPYLKRIKQWAEEDMVTLLYAARDTRVNHAIVLKTYLEHMGV